MVWQVMTMARSFGLIGLVVVALLRAAPAMAASPWDGEWEGDIRQSRLPCSPCKMYLTVSDGVATMRGAVSVPSVVIEPGGAVKGFLTLQIGQAIDCGLRGRIEGDVLTGEGQCIGQGVEPPRLTLHRVSGTAAMPGSRCRRPRA